MKNMLLITAGVVIYVFMWFLVGHTLKVIEVGPNPTYKFSKNFILVRGSLYYLPAPDDLDNQEYAVGEIVKAFFVKNGWLLGKTEKGYFAINLATQQISYPLISEQEVESLSNIKIMPDDWIDSFGKKMESEYLLRNPEVIKFGKGVNIIFGIIFVFLIVGLSLWAKKKNKAAIPSETTKSF